MKAKEDTSEEEFEEIMTKISDRLKKLRIDAGYSSYENFAWDNGINRMQYWKMEKGETNFTMKSLHKVLKAHNMSFQDFFGDKI